MTDEKTNALWERHGELVDKKFLSGLTPGEEVELAEIRAAIDEEEASVYSGVIESLRAMIAGTGKQQY